LIQQSERTAIVATPNHPDPLIPALHDRQMLRPLLLGTVATLVEPVENSDREAGIEAVTGLRPLVRLS